MSRLLSFVTVSFYCIGSAFKFVYNAILYCCGIYAEEEQEKEFEVYASCSSVRESNTCFAFCKQDIVQSKTLDKCDYRWDVLLRSRKRTWEELFPNRKIVKNETIIHSSLS